MRTFWAAAAAAVGSCVVSIAILGVPGAESGGGTLKYITGANILTRMLLPSLKMKPVFLLSMTFLKQTKKCILLWKQAALNMM